MTTNIMDVLKGFGEFASAVQKLQIERETLEGVLLEWIDKHDNKVPRDQPLPKLLRQQIQVVEEKLAAKPDPWPGASALQDMVNETKTVLGAAAAIGEGVREVSKRLRNVLIGAEPGASVVDAVHQARAYLGATGGESVNTAIARARKTLGAVENETVIEAAERVMQELNALRAEKELKS